MYSYLKQLEARLSPEQKAKLQSIYEPTVVAVPLSNARRNVCALPNGELRSYGAPSQNGVIEYQVSRDGGISWETAYSHGAMHSCTYLEKANLYITANDRTNAVKDGGWQGGITVLRSAIGPDDPNPEAMVLREEQDYACFFQPQQSFFTDRIWFTAETNEHACFFFSDDFGETWQERKIAIPDQFEITFPHKGLRWCRSQGTEPYVVELTEDTMMMILRNPLDRFYLSYSHDGGDTWSTPAPSEFYGTNTTAFLLRLQDGRVVTFWNNTKPLPQPNYATEHPYPGENVIDGLGENAFNNRDAAHAAVSEDGGKTWLGYREFLLNPIRNNADFRYAGGTADSIDKSVHQHQAFELPFGKILVISGQNKAACRMTIFDVNWLYETARENDFRKGLVDVTVHTYLKSVSGSHFWDAGNGHCAWNRTYAAYPVPDPDGSYNEVLLVQKRHDDRLLNDIGGVAWNFPASPTGRVTVELKITEKQARFALTDRWYNVCDAYAAVQSPFWFEVDTADIGAEFATVTVDYDTVAGRATVSVNGNFLFHVAMTAPCCTAGLSYLILQCATDGDSQGFYVKSLKKVTDYA